MELNKVLITGAAGFIGHGLALRLLEQGRIVVGLDNLNDYYDVQLKRDRLGHRITSYNVCYTKLLRSIGGKLSITKSEKGGTLVSLIIPIGMNNQNEQTTA